MLIISLHSFIACSVWRFIYDTNSKLQKDNAVGIVTAGDGGSVYRQHKGCSRGTAMCETE